MNNSLTSKEFGLIIRKINKEIGTEKSKYMGSRIRGWGSSTAGIDYDMPKFVWTYQRDWVRTKQYDASEASIMDVSYNMGGTYEAARQEALKAKFEEAFEQMMPAGTWEKKIAEGLRFERYWVNITNPYFGR